MTPKGYEQLLFYLTFFWTFRQTYVFPDWATFGQLENLAVNDNKLSGSVPSSWASPATCCLRYSLQSMQLQNNNFSGSIDWLLNLPFLNCWSIAGNQGLCGKLPQNMTCPFADHTAIGSAIDSFLSCFYIMLNNTLLQISFMSLFW